MIPYALNLSILAVIVYRIYVGMKEGLFNEFINLVNFLFSAGMSFTLFRSLSPYVYKYIFPNEEYAPFIAFWALFILFISIVWSIKQLFLSKIFSMTKEKAIHLFMPVDKIGGAICGILLGLNLMSWVIISLYLTPVTNNLYNLREEGKIIFKVDERWVKTYSRFTEFDWKEFLDTLKPEEKLTKEDKKQEEVSATEEKENRE